MKLRCYALMPEPPKLIPAPPDRDFMDRFQSGHAYRCLPLSVANTYGWQILSPAKFAIHWTGGMEAKDITFEALDGFPYLEHFVSSNFCRGVVTLHSGYLFRTEPGWNLLVSGAFNFPKDGVAPLTGVVETDWLPYPFTLNWQLTRPGTVTVEKDEPVGLVFPVAQGALEAVEPELLDLDSDPDFAKQFEAWKTHRVDFMQRINSKDPQALKQAWQRYYFSGTYPDGDKAGAHQMKLRLATPTNKCKR